jgi:death on curing protein
VSSTEIIWVSESVVLALHDEQLAEHGGASGIRDKSLLLSALARPRNIATDTSPDLADLAAAYAVGIARNHAFVDGNKRTAIVVAAGVFLPLNGYELTAANEEIIRVMLGVADGSLPEDKQAAWFREWMRPIQQEHLSQLTTDY